MKPKFQKLYNNIAHEVAKMSYARRLKVGAVIVKNDRVISMGYNGMPAGWDNNCENIEFMPTDDKTSKLEDYPFTGLFWQDGQNIEQRYRLQTKPEVLHAESNAIAKLARTNDSGHGADLFVTHSPCIECAKLIYQSGISRVYYNQNYKDDMGIRFLKQSGVEVIQHEE